MGHFIEIITMISMLFTAGMLVVLNVMEDRQEKREAKLRKAKEVHEEIKKRWRETEERK